MPGPGGGQEAGNRAGSAEGAPVPAPAAGSTVALGNIGTYSGPLGAVFGGGRPASQVWAQWINANGGLNGHPVKMITADDGGDPNRARSLAQDMVENSKALALFLVAPLTTEAVEPYLREKGVPAISQTYSFIWDTSPILFPAGTSLKYFGPMTARLLSEEGLKKIAIIYCGEVEACRVFNSTMDQQGEASAGTKVVYRAQVSLAQPDFTAECIQAKKNGAEGIMAGMDAASISRLARSCVGQDYRPRFATGGNAVINSLAKDPNVDGLVASQPQFAWIANDVPAARDYQAALKQFAPNLEGSATTAGVWAAGEVLRKASANLPANPTSADILKGLWTIKGDNMRGATPPMSYHEGSHATPASCYFRLKIEGGKWSNPGGSSPVCL